MWLHLSNHWLNMAQALVVDDDATSTPPAVSVVFPGDVKRTLTGGDRLQVLAWLEGESRLGHSEIGEVLQLLEPPLPLEQGGIEFHIKTPDAATLRDTLEALTQAVYAQTYGKAPFLSYDSRSA